MLCLALIVLADCTGEPPKSGQEANTLKPLSELRLEPTLFGAEWRTSPGIVLDDWADLQKLPDGVKQSLAPTRARMEPLGIIALGGFSCVRTKPPLNTVAVRVFLFKDAAMCQAWRDKKYRYSGWQKHYQPVEGLSHFAVDSKQIKKRIVVIGRYWITAHHVGNGDTHLRALKSIVSQLGLAR